MTTAYTVLQHLQDGRFYSGEELASSLNISRASIWKAIESLRKQGLEVHAVTGKGYRLSRPVECLDLDAIYSYMGAESSHYNIEVHQSLDSTNSYLLEQAKNGAENGSVCLAELQTAGRGRRGRQWISPIATNIYMSYLWRTQMAPAAVACGSLICALTVTQALNALGVEGIGVKWPNDVIVQQRKLAGILLEMTGEAYAEQAVVIGIGVNLAMPDEAASAIDQPWIDLSSLTEQKLSRNQIVAKILLQLRANLEQFEREGMQAYLETWNKMDQYAGQEVELHFPQQVITGKVQGIDQYGSLLLQTSEGVKAYQSGEVSLRMSS
ncbi:MAG: bifunctional biotin--[acetyl-CoA-carboxylase] ligase/biotin operon repressor BirA [Gammaproteobacteria bacterium]|nr:bifunctional biotin--[acetyl-CoA-carboxylase] ligase/biotin operon repressor BirA [Gammaproteobacteria bacterium]